MHLPLSVEIILKLIERRKSVRKLLLLHKRSTNGSPQQTKDLINLLLEITEFPTKDEKYIIDFCALYEKERKL